MTTNPISQAFASLLGTAERRVAAVAFAVAIAAAVVGARSWLDEREQRVQLAATVASQNSIIAAAEKREQDRAQQLADTLKQIANLKATVQTPQQVIREIPQYLPPLPQPLQTIPPMDSAQHSGQTPQQGTAGSAGTAQGATAQLPSAPDVRVPAGDLKPLFDFVQDCRACQAQLAAVQQDASDEREKNAALTKERDAAVKAAKGGGVWSRTVRVVRWVAIGFGVGYLARAATH